MSIFLSILSVILILIGSLNCLASDGLSAIVGGLMASTGFICCVVLFVGSEICSWLKKSDGALEHIRIHGASTAHYVQRNAEFWDGRNVRIES